MNYKERAEIIKALSEQSYFDAKVKPQPQKKDVRIGSVDGQTGRSQVFHADGGFSTNGIRVFNAAPPSDRFVRGQQSPSVNSIALGYRDYQQETVSALVAANQQSAQPNRFATIVNIFVYAFSGSPLISLPKSSFGVSTTSPAIARLAYIDDDFDGFAAFLDGNVGQFVPDALSRSNNNINPDLCTVTTAISDQAIRTDISLNAPFIALPPIPPDGVLADFLISFPIVEWREYFEAIDPALRFQGGEVFFDWNISPIELEVLGGFTNDDFGTLFRFGQNTGARVGISRNDVNEDSPSTYSIFADPITAQVQGFPTGGTAYTFVFRYRRRTPDNSLPWFTL